jgi:hypothetical protein
METRGVKIDNMVQIIGKWTYIKGELLLERIQRVVYGAITIIGIMLSIVFIVAYFLGEEGEDAIPLKVNIWVLLILLIPFWLILFIFAYVFSIIFFEIKKLIKTPNEEEINSTTATITAHKRIYILNDVTHTLNEVIIVQGKKQHHFIFNGIATNSKNKESKFSYTIHIPLNELQTANSIMEKYTTILNEKKLVNQL